MIQNEKRQVMNALVLILQLGINMLVPIFMCSLFGIWLGDKTGIAWMMVPFFFVGALAGGTSVYKMVKKQLKAADQNGQPKYGETDRDAGHAKKDQ